MHQNGECQVTQQEAQVNGMGQQQNQSNKPRPPYKYQAQSSIQGNKMSTLESAVEKLTVQTSTFVEQTSNFMNETMINLKNHEASIRKLENQIGQLSRQISERSLGTFPIVTPFQIQRSNVRQFN